MRLNKSDVETEERKGSALGYRCTKGGIFPDASTSRAWNHTRSCESLTASALSEGVARSKAISRYTSAKERTMAKAAGDGATGASGAGSPSGTEGTASPRRPGTEGTASPRRPRQRRPSPSGTPFFVREMTSVLPMSLRQTDSTTPHANRGFVEQTPRKAFHISVCHPSASTSILP